MSLPKSGSGDSYGYIEAAFRLAGSVRLRGASRMALASPFGLCLYRRSLVVLFQVFGSARPLLVL
jgi:hypothetical protein